MFQPLCMELMTAVVEFLVRCYVPGADFGARYLRAPCHDNAGPKHIDKKLKSLRNHQFATSVQA